MNDLPNAPLKPCADMRCPALVPKGTTHCDTHRRADYRRKDAARSDEENERRRMYFTARWAKVRKLVLSQEPLCRVCRRAPSTQVDHIVGLNHGGTNARDNLQGLCATHHSRKTAREKLTQDELYRPTIGKARCPVVVVCGPPGSGKTTYALNVTPNVIDLDQIKAELAGVPVHHAGPEWIEPALRERNRRLANLAAPSTPKQTVCLITSSPKSSDRRWWADTLGTDRVIMLDVDASVCAQRIRDDATRDQALKESSIRGVYSWWNSYSADYLDSRPTS